MTSVELELDGLRELLFDVLRLGYEGAGRNPNTVTSLGSPKEEIRRMPALATVSTTIPYGR
jgi:hypothetical protein